jgi:hypothetical protein
MSMKRFVCTALLAIGPVFVLGGCAQGGDEEPAGSASALSDTVAGQPSSFQDLTDAAYDAARAFAPGDDCTFTAEAADGSLKMEIKKQDGSSARLFALMTWPVTFEEHTTDSHGSFERTFHINSRSTLTRTHVYKDSESVTISGPTTTLSCSIVF